MATLDELLALLPDNTTGEISAEDMREVVTGLWDETELAVKTVNDLPPDETGNVETPEGITLLPAGSEPPVGSPPGIYAFIPSGVPEVFASISYDTEGNDVECPIPEGVQVGDAVVFIPGFVPASPEVNTITCDNDGWVELWDFSPQQARKPAAFVYRVSDATALANLGVSVTAVSGDTGRRAGVTYAIPGSLVDEAWPAYASGSNRSAATINANTDVGCTMQAIGTVTVPFHEVVLVVMHDADSSPAASDGFTQVAWASGSAGGAEPFTLTVLARASSTAPVPEAVVTHAPALSSTHGGGQFIIPVA